MAGIDDTPSGASALSPSKKLLAVTNLADGVDWYGVEERAFLRSTIYSSKEKFIVGLGFLSKNAIIVGHSRGDLIIASTVMERDPQHFQFLPGRGSKYRSQL
jgi:hypothetical protein